MLTAKVYKSRNTGLWLVVVKQERTDSYVVECSSNEGARNIAMHLNNGGNVLRPLGEHEREAQEGE